MYLLVSQTPSHQRMIWTWWGKSVQKAKISNEFVFTTEGGQLNLILDRGAAVSQLEQARVDQTAVVPGSYGPSPCPNVTALVQFGIAAFFFVAGSRGEGFPRTFVVLYGG